MNAAARTSVADALLAAKAGDREAMLMLLVTSQPNIRRYARRTCRLEDVDDAVQETLAAMARRVTALRSPAALFGWLFVVVKRECYRLARRSARFREPPDAFAGELILRPELELRCDLANAINSLPEHYRRIVIARDLRSARSTRSPRPTISAAKRRRRDCGAPASCCANTSAAAVPDQRPAAMRPPGPLHLILQAG